MAKMSIKNIREQYQKLSQELMSALSTMERSDKIFTIREEIKQLQNICPHGDGSYDFSDHETCPYCGKKFRK